MLRKKLVSIAILIGLAALIKHLYSRRKKELC